MENPQMGMPAEMAPQGLSPDQMAIFEQMRQEISPQEFSNEMLAGASQVDPQAVAEFTQELQGLDMPPEALDALNDVVDEILANPGRYDELRAQYMDQGLPEDILPEQFDPQFFAALNMAIDQMIAAPTGVQAFAKGGIAELKPIAKAIASYGRNGDTMLAHITPAEARMLRRRGGSGTINPKTGLPEFFLKKLWKAVTKPLRAVGKAVKKFAQSSIGRIVLPIALGFFLGPAAAAFLNVTSVAGVAAISGFVGSSLSTAAAGGNLKDSLKAGAIGGLTAGATAGVLNGTESFASGSYSGAGLTPGQALQGQVDKFTGVFSPATGLNAAGAAPVPTAIAGDTAAGAQFGIGDPGAGFESALKTGPAPSSAAYDLNMQGQRAAATNMPATGGQAGTTGSTPYSDLKMTGSPSKPFPEYFGDQPQPAASAQTGGGQPSAYKPGGPTIGESFSKMGEGLGMGSEPASFKTFTEGATDLFSPGPTNAQLTARAQEIMRTTPGTSLKDAMTMAKEMSPGMLRTYGPAAVAGLGAMSAFGGFDTKPVQGGAITQSLMKPVTQRIAEDGTQRQMYMQGLPGVKYDQYGAPIFGEYSRLPTYDVPDYNSGGFGMYGSSDQGIMDVPTMYSTPAGSIGSRRVAQPYNNAYMYSNLVPRRAADGGMIQHFDAGGDVVYDTATTATTATTNLANKANAKTPEEIAADAAKAAADAQALRESQAANRARVAQEKALKKAQGSGNMYANINAGLSALAPENFPGAPVALSAERRAAMTNAFSGATTDADYARAMQANGYRPEEVAALTNRSFGDINRRYNTAQRREAYAPMLQGQRDAMAEQSRILGGPVTQPPVTQPPVTQPPVDVGGPITTMPITPPPGSSIDTGIKYSNQDIQSYLAANPGMTDAQIRGAMDQFGVGVDQMAAATGLPVDQVQGRYDTASNYNNQAIQDYLAANPGMTDAQIRGAMDQFGVGTAQMAAATGLPMDQIQQRYDYAGSTAAPYTPAGNITGNLFEDIARDNIAQNAATTQRGGYSNQDIQNYLSSNPNLTDSQIRLAMDNFGVGVGQMAAATGLPMDQVQQRYTNAAPVKLLNMGGIAGLAAGGYPRRTGQISGPGTEKSDSIPAMLSDGEFVMTAKAVRGAGKGSRRAGAKQMYKLMHQLEKNSERG